MTSEELGHSFGVLKPVGHVVISVPTEEHARQVLQALPRIGIEVDAVRHLGDQEMLRLLDEGLAAASPLAGIGQEANLAQAQRTLAARGYHFLVVRAENREQATQIADAAKPFAAERAQYYGHLVIEELIEHADAQPQVAESPDRGLDAQTPSGREGDHTVS